MTRLAGLFTLVLFFAAVAGLPAQPAATLLPYDLRVDNLSEPLGVDSPAPRFAWKLRAAPAARGARQTAWQLRVGTTPASANAWDSGQVASSSQLNVPYAGRALRSHEMLFWQVRVWDENSRPSNWSEPATFTVGTLTAADWGGRPLDQRPRPAFVATTQTRLLLHRSHRRQRREMVSARPRRLAPD